jgi:hypothetical protein
MNIPSNISKSTLLAMCVFWAINFTKDFDLDFSPFVLLSIIPISICVTIVLLFTICPFFWILKKKEESNSTLFKRCFPYYTIVVFGLCLFAAFASNFEFYYMNFLITAYVTTAQSWVWFAKEK